MDQGGKECRRGTAPPIDASILAERPAKGSRPYMHRTDLGAGDA